MPAVVPSQQEADLGLDSAADAKADKLHPDFLAVSAGWEKKVRPEEGRTLGTFQGDPASQRDFSVFKGKKKCFVEELHALDVYGEGNVRGG